MLLKIIKPDFLVKEDLKSFFSIIYFDGIKIKIKAGLNLRFVKFNEYNCYFYI